MECYTAGCGRATTTRLRIYQPRTRRVVQGQPRCEAHLPAARARLEHAGYGVIVEVKP